MSGHADTILEADRLSAICSLRRFTPQEAEEAVDVLLAIPELVAENQQLRDALEQIDAAGRVEVRYGGQIAGAMKDIARAALAGTPSEATG
jgi:hypothetical protein